MHVFCVQVHGSKHSQLTSCFKYLLKEGGIKSLWRGNGINVLKIAPESAIKFAAYEQGKRMVLQFGGGKERELSIFERFVAGSFAGGISQSVIYPLEVSCLCSTTNMHGIPFVGQELYFLIPFMSCVFGNTS